MSARKSLYACLLAAVLVVPSGALAASGSRPTGKPVAGGGPLLQSRQLWATINVCNASDQPDTVGIRGSMPGDRQAHDTMYMRFRLQYLDATKHWADLANGAEPGFVAIGTAKSARQDGRSFQLVPVPGKPAFMLRGVVSFQWRRGATIVQIGLPAHDRRASEPRGGRSARVQRGFVLDWLNRRGSFVMIPSTPIAVSLAMWAASSTVQTYSSPPPSATARTSARRPRASGP